MRLFTSSIVSLVLVLSFPLSGLCMNDERDRPLAHPSSSAFASAPDTTLAIPTLPNLDQQVPIPSIRDYWREASTDHLKIFLHDVIPLLKEGETTYDATFRLPGNAHTYVLSFIPLALTKPKDFRAWLEELRGYIATSSKIVVENRHGEYLFSFHDKDAHGEPTIKGFVFKIDKKS